MKTIYLIRHGTPAFTQMERHYYCLTEYPLSEVGKEDALLLADKISGLQAEPFTLYSSPLLRARETALPLLQKRPESGPIVFHEGLIELSCGSWEGRTFSQLKAEETELFAQILTLPHLYAPPEGENYDQGQKRITAAISDIMEESEGDVVIVAHRMVNLLFLASVMGWSLESINSHVQPYGCYNILHYEEGVFSAQVIGALPAAQPSPQKTKFMLEQYQVPLQVRQHSSKVRELALAWGEALQALGYKVDLQLLSAAADLHDIARHQPLHSQAGADILLYEGYPAVAAVVAAHHDLVPDEHCGIDEAALLYLADKYCREDQVVGLAERFEASYARCSTDEARVKHRQRRADAERVEQCLFAALGLERVQNIAQSI